MPELPEVETILRGLRQGNQSTPSLLNQTIVGASLFWQKTLAEPEPAIFLSKIANNKINNISRRGKFCVFHLNHDFLLIHLRMSGDLYLRPDMGPSYDLKPKQAHERLYLHLDSGWGLVFYDTRKFGRVWLTSKPESILGQLGLEPLDPHLDSDLFYSLLQSKSRQLKPLLMDQRFLAGLGNIYTDEALFDARINPLRLSNTLSPDEAADLLNAIRKMLLSGIRDHGASIDWVYRGGNFQNHFQVYQKTGSPCPRCGNPINRTVVGQRSTHYCPLCQPMHK